MNRHQAMRYTTKMRPFAPAASTLLRRIAARTFKCSSTAAWHTERIAQKCDHAIDQPTGERQDQQRAADPWRPKSRWGEQNTAGHREHQHQPHCAPSLPQPNTEKPQPAPDYCADGSADRGPAAEIDLAERPHRCSLGQRRDQEDQQTADAAADLPPYHLMTESKRHLSVLPGRHNPVKDHQLNRVRDQLHDRAQRADPNKEPEVCAIDRKAAVQNLSEAQWPQSIGAALIVAHASHFRTLGAHPSGRTHPRFSSSLPIPADCGEPLQIFAFARQHSTQTRRWDPAEFTRCGWITAAFVLPDHTPSGEGITAVVLLN